MYELDILCRLTDLLHAEAFMSIDDSGYTTVLRPKGACTIKSGVGRGHVSKTKRPIF
jgi:hypothetical protein